MGCREVYVLVLLTMQGLCKGCQDLNQLPSALTVVITAYLKQAKGKGEGEGEREKKRYINLLHVTLQNAHI